MEVMDKGSQRHPPLDAEALETPNRGPVQDRQRRLGVCRALAAAGLSALCGLSDSKDGRVGGAAGFFCVPSLELD